MDCKRHKFNEQGWEAAGLVEWCRCGVMRVVVSYTEEARKCVELPGKIERREFVRQFGEAHDWKRARTLRKIVENLYRAKVTKARAA